MTRLACYPPRHSSYDIIIVGGAIMGAATAWFLTEMDDFDGRVLVVERDLTYEFAASSMSSSCIRQQFSTELNVHVSQFAADFIKNLRAYMGGDERVPELEIQNFGYLYLADNDAFARYLRDCHALQVAAGAATRLLTPDQIAARFPFYNLEDIQLGSLNQVDEGCWDATAVFDWLRRSARERGVEFVQNEVTDMTLNTAGTSVQSVTLASGEVVSCGQVVNASGTRAARTAAMAGISLPVEPRKRFTWIFSAAQPLDQDLPLTIDPSGVFLREYGGGTYQAGGYVAADPAVDPDDFTMDHSIWEEHIWPVIATRIPQFEAIKVQSEWAAHYDFNTLDHNAILGPHDRIKNFFFLNGFSGHGLQQAPAMGRATAELLVHGEYRSLDMSKFDYQRVADNRALTEHAVI